MLSSYHTLQAVAASLDRNLRTEVIRTAFSQERDTLILACGGSSDVVVISCRPEAPVLYLHRDFKRARANSVELLPEVCGAMISSVSIHPSDRIVTFRLSDGRSLRAALFGPRSNVLLVDSAGSIISAFKRARELAGTRFMESPENPLYDLSSLPASFAHSPEERIDVALRRTFPTLGATLAREALHRSSLVRERSVASLSPKEVAVLRISLGEILSELSSPSPVVYLAEDGSPSEFSLIRLRHLGALTAKPFADIHDAVRFTLSRSRAATAHRNRLSGIRQTLAREREKALRSREAAAGDLAEHDRAARYSLLASLLMEHPDAVTAGAAAVSIDSENGPVEIPLDRKLSPLQNAQRYFEKARRARAARAEASHRLERLDHRVKLAGDLIAALEGLHRDDDVRTFLDGRAPDLELFGIGKRSEARKKLPFRIFAVEGGFEVWAGKNSANNDLLTFKHARPRDLWFHARGSGGSHVVLKIDSAKGPPGKKAMQQAAAIAAYYSGMRGASTVPVAVTERKYVRKPRGAPAGTVTLEREDVIFAKPGLPPGPHD